MKGIIKHYSRYVYLSIWIFVSFSIFLYAGELDDDNNLQGANLSADQVQKMEEQLAKNPEDLVVRSKLLNYYMMKQFESTEVRNKRQEHVLWVIKNHQDSKIAGDPQCELNPMIDVKVYSIAKELWLSQASTYSKNPIVLGNAANFFYYQNQICPRIYLERHKL